MLNIKPSEIPLPRLHQYLLGSIAPRPIAFASTIDGEGRPNLSPFSFFNVFGVNPTTLIFSPSRRGRDNTVKNTYENVKVVPETVINVVNWDIVEQVSLASSEYPKGINEFTKSGLTMQPSELVRPFRVEESPVQFECRVREIIETGPEGGAGNLVVCEILMIHIKEEILDEKGIIDPQKIRLVGRMGGSHYTRAFGDAVFEVEKPLANPGIGVDSLPEHVRHSKVLTGNDLGRLGNLAEIPDEAELREQAQREDLREMIDQAKESDLHHIAKRLIGEDRVYDALVLLLLQ